MNNVKSIIQSIKFSLKIDKCKNNEAKIDIE